MIYDLQKAGILKRCSAMLLDLILLVILAVGFASVISAIVGYDDMSGQLEGYYQQYENEYGVTFEITAETYEAMTEAERANYDAAYDALISDDDAMYVYNMVLNLTLIIVTFSILAAFLLLEFAVPLFLKNGQTVGKKVFAIGVVRTNCVRINGVCLFIRTVLGKYTVETMIPVLIVLMLMFGLTNMIGTMIILAILGANLILLIVNRSRSVIHDLLADTAVVDMATQMIFDTQEDLVAYKTKLAQENAAKQSY